MRLTDITEGTFGDLVSMAAAKIGNKPEDRLAVKADQNLHNLVQQAKQFQFHLFDGRAIPWWGMVFDHFNIPGDKRRDVLAAAKSEFAAGVDTSLFEADFSKIADTLNPRTRASTVKSSARAAVNGRLAIAIIGYVSRAANNIQPEKPKSKAVLPAKAKAINAQGVHQSSVADDEKIRAIDDKNKKRAIRIGRQIVYKKTLKGQPLKPQEWRKLYNELDNLGYRIIMDPGPGYKHPIIRRKTD